MKRIFKFGYILLTASLFHSCFVAKEYQTPKNLITQNYFRTDDFPADSLTMADISWEEMFTDTILQNYIRRALENNIDIRVALKQIEISEAYVKQGRLNYYPAFSADIQYARNRASSFGAQQQAIAAGADPVSNFWTLGGNVSWEADIWGKLKSERRAFDAAYLQSVAAHQAVKTGIIAGIASAYYQLLAVDEQIKVSESTLQSRKRGFETTKAIMESGHGFVSRADVERAEAQYIGTQSIIIDLKRQAELLSNFISILMGEETREIRRSTLSEQKVSTGLALGVPAQLLSNRPDVVAAEKAYMQAFELTNIAAANRYTSLTISGRGGLDAQAFRNWFDPKAWASGLAAGIAAPVFQKRALKTQHEVTQARQEQALLHLRGTLLLAYKEVSDALSNYEAANENISVKTKANALLNQAVEDINELFIQGYNNTSYIEVLLSQENALNSDFDLINTKAAKLNSIVALYQALGGGWK